MLGLFELDILQLLLTVVAFVSAITVHEFAHAFVANRLGDPTPKLQGRLTLNPVAHLDPIGILLPIVMMLFRSSFIFGWGKPVMFDIFNLKNPRRDTAIIAIAGPISNLIMASLLSLILRVLLLNEPISPFAWLAVSLIEFNVLLAIFNLLPMHPLDGGKILVGLLPRKDSIVVDNFMHRYGIFILFLLVFPIFGSSLVGPIMFPVIRFLLQIYIPGTSLS